jgi:hypothetical protein
MVAGLGAGRCTFFGTELKLHQYRDQPASELETDLPERPDPEDFLYVKPTFRPLFTNSVNLGHLAKMPPWTLLIMMTVST